jgi:hypothetical protein
MAESCGLLCTWCQSAQLACVSSIEARLGPGSRVNVGSKRCTTGTVTHTRGVCGAHTVGSIGRSLGLGVGPHRRSLSPLMPWPLLSRVCACSSFGCSTEFVTM